MSNKSDKYKFLGNPTRYEGTKKLLKKYIKR